MNENELAVTIKNLASGSENMRYELTFTAESNSTVVITSDGTSGDLATTTASGSRQTITLSKLSRKSQILTATTINTAGNSTTATIPVIVDNAAPSITSLSLSSKPTPIPVHVLRANEFIDHPDYKDLYFAFKHSHYGEGKKPWYWHQLVDMVLEPPEKRAYMYERTLSLLSDFGDSYKKYFILRTVSGLYHVPNILAKLNRLKILYYEFFQIYENILNRIHFEYPKVEQTGRIQGKINWSKTIHMSAGEFPVNFITTTFQKNFETPENILLILCVRWMLTESNYLLNVKFNEPLHDENKKLLHNISEKCMFMLDKFPFQNVLTSSKKLGTLSYNPPDPKIKEIEFDTKKRISDGKIKNTNYLKLLEWIEKFRDLRINNIDNKSPTRHILESLKNVDTVYEIWIFMEFVSYLRSKNLLINFELGSNPKCEFDHNGVAETFWYARSFDPIEQIVWAKPHDPDFIAMIGNDVLGVFDAKNYAEGESLGGTHDKMLSYMNNFDTNFGALIYPNYPISWDSMSESKKIQKITEILKTKFPDAPNTEIKNKRKELLALKWIKLPDEFKKKFPRAVESIDQSKNSKYHFNQTLAFLRMSPENTTSLIEIKNETMDFIYKTIVNSIPLIISQKT